MDFIKKYWWLLLLIPIGGYLLWVSMRAKKEVNESLAKAREAKEAKRLIKELELTPNDNGRNNQNDSININQN